MNEDINERKKELRKEVFEKRANLPESYAKAANQTITNKVLEHPYYKESQNIFVFYSVEDEFNTHPLIKQALADGKNVSIPRVADGKKGIMKAHKYEEGNDLVESSFGIPEPSPEQPEMEPSEIDLIIMPCVTCNNKGERLGYGGGFYDRFLTNFSGKTILPFYSELQTDNIPTEPHDRKPDVIVTEKTTTYIDEV